MTTTLPATFSSHRSASLGADDVRRVDRIQTNDGLDAISSRDGAFATLVESLRVSESVGVTDLAASLSPEIFEAGDQSTIEKQRAESDAEHKEQTLLGSDNTRFDRTGVQARSNSASGASAQQQTNTTLGAFNNNIAQDSYGSALEQNLVPTKDDGFSGANARSNAAALQEALSATAANANNTGKHESLDLIVNQNAANISTLSTSAAGGAISTAGRSAASPAQQLGQLLGLERTGESAGARVSSSSAVVAPSDAGQANSSRSQDAGSSRVSTKDDSAPSANKTGEPTPTDFSKLVRSLRMQTGEHRSSARLHLTPPELGRVIVDVRLEGDVIQIDVQAETEEGRQLLTERAAQLRLALENVGVVLDRLNVVMSVQPENLVGADRTGNASRFGTREADVEAATSEDIEPWYEQPEELMAATMRATRKKLGFTNRARLDVRA